MSSGCLPKASRLRTSCRPTSRSASSAPRRSNLLIATTSAKSSMSIFSSWEAAPNSGVITYIDDVDERHDRRVALADARRLHDDQVEAGGLERRRSRRPGTSGSSWLPRVASERKKTRSPSREFIRIRSPSSAPPPRRRVGSTASTAMRSLSCWSTRKPAHQLVGQRRLAGAAGAGDAEHRARRAAAAAARSCSSELVGEPPASAPVMARATASRSPASDGVGGRRAVRPTGRRRSRSIDRS